MATIRVLLADDHAVVRRGLRAILADEPDLALVGEATTGAEAQLLCEELRPDVLLLDLSMADAPASVTVTVVRARSPQTRVVMLTAHHDEAAVRELVALGVVGYVLKDDTPEAVAQAIRSVMQGGTWFSRPVMATLVRMSAGAAGSAPDAAPSRLTDRERQLLTLLAQGWEVPRMAAALGVTEPTLRNYLSRPYGKLGVHGRPEAMVWAHAHGLGDA